MGFYPELETLLQTGETNRLLVLRRSFRASIGLILLFVLLIIGILIFAIKTANSDSMSGHGWGAMIRVLMLLPVAVGLEVVRRYYNDLYVIGRDKVTHYRGRISLKFGTPSIRNIDLRAITVAQGLMGRILDYGDVSLATAAQEGPEIIMVGVRSPHELSKLIDELRQKSQKASFENVTSEQALTRALQND